MTRHEFTAAVKRQALERSGGQCEAVGERYGLPHGVRCHRRVHARRVNYEHYPRGAHDPHPETRQIGNCWAICPECNAYAAAKFDTPREQKIKRTTYDHQLHEARMARKAGQDVPDPEKPRGRQGKKGPPIRGRGFQQFHRPMRSRGFQPRRD